MKNNWALLVIASKLSDTVIPRMYDISNTSIITVLKMQHWPRHASGNYSMSYVCFFYFKIPVTSFIFSLYSLSDTENNSFALFSFLIRAWTEIKYQSSSNIGQCHTKQKFSFALRLIQGTRWLIQWLVWLKQCDNI